MQLNSFIFCSCVFKGSEAETFIPSDYLRAAEKLSDYCLNRRDVEVNGGSFVVVSYQPSILLCFPKLLSS
jgi:hypothetical protein